MLGTAALHASSVVVPTRRKNIMRASFAIAIVVPTFIVASALAQAPTQSQAPADQAPTVQTPAPQAPAESNPPPRPSAAPSQTAPSQAPAAKGPSNPAVKTGEGNNPNAAAPVAGANSFTENE